MDELTINKVKPEFKKKKNKMITKVEAGMQTPSIFISSSFRVPHFIFVSSCWAIIHKVLLRICKFENYRVRIPGWKHPQAIIELTEVDLLLSCVLDS